MTRALDPAQLETLLELSRASWPPARIHCRKSSAMNDLTPEPTAMARAVVSAGVSDPSSTRLLADRIAQKTVDTLRESGVEVTVSVIDLGPIAVDIAQSIVSGFPRRKVQEAIERLAAADAIIASTPVYKAAISGLFKSFADLIDNDLLIAKPVILAATGGTARHAMVVDEQMRPLFAFLRAIPRADLAVRRPRGLGIRGPRQADRPRRHRTRRCSCAAARPATSPTTTGTATSTSSPATRPARTRSVAGRRLQHRPDAPGRRGHQLIMAGMAGFGCD